MGHDPCKKIMFNVAFLVVVARRMRCSMLWLCVVVLHVSDGHDPTKKFCEADTSSRLPKDTQHFQNNKRTPSSTEAREPEESHRASADQGHAAFPEQDPGNDRVPLLKDMQHFQDRNRETTVNTQKNEIMPWAHTCHRRCVAPGGV